MHIAKSIPEVRLDCYDEIFRKQPFVPACIFTHILYSIFK